MTLVSGPGRAESQEAGGAGVGGWECREGQSKASLKDLPDSPELSGQFRDFHPKADFHKLSFPPCLA